MTVKIRYLVLAVTSLACLATIGARGRTVNHSPAHNYRLLPSMLAEYAADSGNRFPAQFGLTILNGIAALQSDLDELEEPPPNPQSPRPMARDAIYFGGTDCGRFIPESLVLNDGVRPDISVITQNALADETYLEILRQRLAGRSWVPQPEESAEAFKTYVTEVQSGARPNNGDIRIENGRVEVTGSLAVMEINGLLAKMMFDHNKETHDFYLEESYVMPWMYDYLSPHGLVMKLNADKVDTFNESDLTADREFWDWQTRRLLDNPMYCRRRAERWRQHKRKNARKGIDNTHRVACRAYSKLRCSIAGLYAWKTRQNPFQNFRYACEAAAAFREAYMLDPQSPEAAFRYIQQILLVNGKWDAMLDILDYVDLMDPSGKSTGVLKKCARIAGNASRTLNTILSNHGSERMPGILNVPLPDRVVKELTPEEADLLFDTRLDYAEVCKAIGGNIRSVKYALRETEGKRSPSFTRMWKAATILYQLGDPDNVRLSARCAEDALAFPEAKTFEVQNMAVDIFDKARQNAKCLAAIEKAMEFPESQKSETMTRYASTLLKLDQKTRAESLILQQALKLKDAKTSAASLIEAGRILAKIDRDKHKNAIEQFLGEFRSRKNLTREEYAAYFNLIRELRTATQTSHGQNRNPPSSNR